MKNPSSNDHLWKVRPLLDQFAARCHELQKEEQFCADEQIVPSKGRLNIKRYVKGKPHPWGVKILMLCGESGLVYDFLLYQGSTTNLEGYFKQRYGIIGAIVSHLASSIPSDVGYKLFFDNYFTSLPLLRALLGRTIFAAGTVRPNRCKKCPLKTERELKKNRRGSSDCMVTSDGTIAVTRWMDNKAVTMASNFVAAEAEDTARC